MAGVSNHHVSALITQLITATQEKDTLSVQDVLQRFKGRANAPLLLVLALLLVTIGGIPAVAPAIATLIILVAFQGLVGGKLWVPRALRTRSVRASKARKALKAVLPFVKRMEHLSKPRWQSMVASPWQEISQVIVLVLGLSVYFVSWIPGALFAPGAAIAALSVARFQRDGVLMGMGLVVSLGSMAMLLAALH